ncbi:hypothetical protein CSUI_009715 [Cystoisospora suis]|uniref:Uncharacterized protein n=1 Tax=Cystoisospora suis TaxID=483139 RepID=A0A2C6KH68_9APIC|nr:hypothetical protein CSUI_009715 [Cystoisospora suis]
MLARPCVGSSAVRLVAMFFIFERLFSLVWLLNDTNPGESMYELMCRRRDGSRTDPLSCCLGERREGSEASSDSSSSPLVSSRVRSSSPLGARSLEGGETGSVWRDIASPRSEKQSVQDTMGGRLAEDGYTGLGYSQRNKAQQASGAAVTIRGGAEGQRHNAAGRPSQSIEAQPRDAAWRHSRTPKSLGSRADGVATANELSSVAVPFAVHGEVFPSRYFAEVSAAASLIRDHMRSCGVSESTLSGDLLSPGHPLYDRTAVGAGGVGRRVASEELNDGPPNSLPPQFFPDFPDYVLASIAEHTSGENSSCPGLRAGDSTLVVRLNVDGSRSVSYTPAPAMPDESLPRLSYPGRPQSSVWAGWLPGGVNDAPRAVVRDPLDLLVDQLLAGTYPGGTPFSSGVTDDASGSQQSLQASSAYFACAAPQGAHHFGGVMHDSARSAQPSLQMADGYFPDTTLDRVQELPGVMRSLAEPPGLPFQVAIPSFPTADPAGAQNVSGMINASLASERLNLQTLNACSADTVSRATHQWRGAMSSPSHPHQLPLQMNACFSSLLSSRTQDSTGFMNGPSQSLQLPVQGASPYFPGTAPTEPQHFRGMVTESVASQQQTHHMGNPSLHGTARAGAGQLIQVVNDSSDSPHPPPQMVNACFPGAAPAGVHHLDEMTSRSPESLHPTLQMANPWFAGTSGSEAQLSSETEVSCSESQQLNLQVVNQWSPDTLPSDAQRLDGVTGDMLESGPPSVVMNQIFHALRAGVRLLNGVMSEPSESGQPGPETAHLSAARTSTAGAQLLSGTANTPTRSEQLPLQVENRSPRDTVLAADGPLTAGMASHRAQSQQLPLQAIHEFFSAAVRAGARLLNEVSVDPSESAQPRLQVGKRSGGTSPAEAHLVSQLLTRDPTKSQQLAHQAPGNAIEPHGTSGRLIAAEDNGTMMYLLQVQERLKNQTFPNQSEWVSPFHQRRRVKSVFWTWRHSRQQGHECKLCQEEHSRRPISAAPPAASSDPASLRVNC